MFWPRPLWEVFWALITSRNNTAKTALYIWSTIYLTAVFDRGSLCGTVEGGMSNLLRVSSKSQYPRKLLEQQNDAGSELCHSTRL